MHQLVLPSRSRDIDIHDIDVNQETAMTTTWVGAVRAALAERQQNMPSAGVYCRMGFTASKHRLPGLLEFVFCQLPSDNPYSWAAMFCAKSGTAPISTALFPSSAARTRTLPQGVHAYLCTYDSMRGMITSALFNTPPPIKIISGS